MIKSLQKLIQFPAAFVLIRPKFPERVSPLINSSRESRNSPKEAYVQSVQENALKMGPNRDTLKHAVGLKSLAKRSVKAVIMSSFERQP